VTGPPFSAKVPLGVGGQQGLPFGTPSLPAGEEGLLATSMQCICMSEISPLGGGFSVNLGLDPCHLPPPLDISSNGFSKLGEVPLVEGALSNPLIELGLPVDGSGIDMPPPPSPQSVY
jgi:hypothetical protein